MNVIFVSNHHYRVSPSVAPLLFAILCTDASIGGGQCNDALSHPELVVLAHQAPRDLYDHEQMLNALQCLAQSDTVEKPLAQGAVRAIFAIATTDLEARARLLDIIGNEKTILSAHRLACELLVYVSDEDTAEQMLRKLRELWPTNRWGGYFEFFRETGYVEFFDWLHAARATGDLAVLPASLVDDYDKCAVLYRDQVRLIRELENSEGGLDAAWALRQATRYGVERGQLRNAVSKRITACGQDFRCIVKNRKLIAQATEAGIDLPLEEEHRKLLNQFHTEQGVFPTWAATRIAEKRAEFYKHRASPEAPSEKPNNP